MVRTDRSRARILPVCLAAALLAGGPLASGGESSSGGASEYQIKAAYLFYFSTFATWPSESFAGDGTLVIGVLGEDPFGDILEQTMLGKTVNGRRLVVKRFDSVKDARDSQLLFISGSERDHLSHVLTELEDTPVLTVSEIDRFAFRGGQIGFRTEEKKVRFDINADAVEHAGIKISSQLMKLGRIVHESEPPRQ